MRDTAALVFGICAVMTVLYALRPRGGEERMLSFAFALILTAAIANPVASLIRSFASGEAVIPSLGVQTDDYPALGAQAAFTDGIAQAVEEKFSLPHGTVNVRVSGFSYPGMQAERVFIRLSGRAVFADNRAVAAFVSQAVGAECEVTLDAG